MKADAWIDIAAIQMHHGLFELICLDAPLPGMRADRISAITRREVDRAIARLLPDSTPEQGFRLLLGGVISVNTSEWLELKSALVRNAAP